MDAVRCAFNTPTARPRRNQGPAIVGQAEAAMAQAFHKSFPEYEPTPLHALPHLAGHLGLAAIHVKDESFRFGLNAFKVLGASYAMGRFLAERLERDIAECPAPFLTSRAVREALGPLTFTTATDGNHGRAVAWAAARMRQRAVVYMPKGSDPARLAHIRALGAEASITDLNYDDAVRLSHSMAKAHGWTIVQDTAWDGYTEIPTAIMQGYTTLALEAWQQLRDLEADPPTHLFLQAGVGSFAGAVLGFFADALGPDTPTTVILEPKAADCIHRSFAAGDGQPHAVTGDLATLMAGLACGEPSTVSFAILRDHATAALSCADRIAANGMRILGCPLPGDPAITSGESGAVGAGALAWLMTDPDAAGTRERLGLGPDSRVLLVSTEGDTSPQTYRDVVWYGQG